MEISPFGLSVAIKHDVDKIEHLLHNSVLAQVIVAFTFKLLRCQQIIVVKQSEKAHQLFIWIPFSVKTCCDFGKVDASSSVEDCVEMVKPSAIFVLHGKID